MKFKIIRDGSHYRIKQLSLGLFWQYPLNEFGFVPKYDSIEEAKFYIDKLVNDATEPSVTYYSPKKVSK